MHDLVINNGLLITPTGPRRADLAVDGERIAAIGPGLTGDRVINAGGCYVLPGAVDQHVHLQMPLAGRVSTDDFATGTLAAACGGTTTVIDFVTPEPGQSMADGLQLRKAEADPKVVVDYGLHMTIPAWHAAETSRLIEVPAMVQAGCATFKLYQAYPGMMLDDVMLLRAFEAIAAAGGRAVLHSETGPVLDELRAAALAEGHISPIWHEKTRPPALEATAIDRAAALAQIAGCPLLIFHVGCAAAVDAIAAARHRGAVTGESCPQYLIMTADEHLAGPEGQLYICAPPLRSRADQDALWAALADGTLDVVSTDHCPWLREEKDQPDFAAVPGGVPSIEARLSLLHHFGVATGRLTLTRWVELCCTNPARLMGLTKKGALTVGRDADIVIFDPAARMQLETETLHEAADWTPYTGITVDGWPRTVLLRGRPIIVDQNPQHGQTGGRFVHRSFNAGDDEEG